MELTDIQTAIVICIYLFGVFSCRFATQFFEVLHAARLVDKTVYRCLLMCSKVHEDVEFLREVKRGHLEKSGYDKSQIREFIKVDDRFIESWKETVVQTLVINAPRSFAFVLKFTNWREAMAQLDEMHKERQ